MNKPVLTIKDLRTHFALDEGILKAVDGVDLNVGARTTVGIIGESGCGKSVTAQSILRIVPSPGFIKSGQILLHRDEGESIDMASLEARGSQIRSIRGKEIAMVFQEPLTSFSPVHTIGSQIEEAVELHTSTPKSDRRKHVVDMLAKVGISNPSQRFDEYPHQLSGGMRQRAMIAMALSCNPRLLIADEPTTALDVTVQAQILDLMRMLQEQFGMATLYITHDLGVIAEIADEINVMYLGRVVERAVTVELFNDPLHPYTHGLLKSIPSIDAKGRDRLEAIHGSVPFPINQEPQCGFFSRCPHAMPGKCDAGVPALESVKPGHDVRCLLHSEVMEETGE